MPCDLAKSITRCAVAQEHLQKLLTDHGEQVASIVQDYLTQHQTYGTLSPRVMRRGGGISIQLGAGGWSAIIRNGQIRLDAVLRGEEAAANQFVRDLTELLGITADELFTQEVEAFIGDALVQTQEVEVENAGRRQQATVFTVNL